MLEGNSRVPIVKSSTDDPEGVVPEKKTCNWMITGINVRMLEKSWCIKKARSVTDSFLGYAFWNHTFGTTSTIFYNFRFLSWHTRIAFKHGTFRYNPYVRNNMDLFS